MVGYGPEDNHFVLELTYNYPVKSYDMGNDFVGITIKSKQVLKRAKANNWPILPGNVLESPGGYKFYILDEPQHKTKGTFLLNLFLLLTIFKTIILDPVVKVTLASSNLKKSINYWNKILGLKIFNQTEKSVQLGFGDGNQTLLELNEIGM